MSPTAAAQAVDGGAGTATTYGLLRRDGLVLALPLAVLREVVACPDAVEPLPQALDGLVGAHVLRGQPVPIADLSSALGGRRSVAPSSAQILAVLVHDGAVLGVLADAAEGIITARAEDHTAMRRPATGATASIGRSMVQHPGVEGVITVVDVQALFDRFADALVEDRPRATEVGAGSRWTGGDLPQLLLRCGDVGLGLPIDAIDGMQTTGPVEPSTLTGGVCLGTVRYRRADVPIVDLLAVLGLGTTPGAADPGECLVVRLDGGFVALRITAVVQLAHVDPAAVRLPPAFGLRRPEVLAGLLELERVGDFALIRGAALTEDPELQTLARLNVGEGAGAGASPHGMPGRDGRGQADRPSEDGGPPADPRAVSRVPMTYLTFACPVEAAVALADVEQIIDVPDALVRVATTAPWLPGVFVHRGETLPLVDLRGALGLPVPPEPVGVGAPAVLIVAGPQGRRVGLQVDRLLSIEPSTALVPPGQVPPGGGTGAVGGALETLPYAVVAEGQDAERMVPVLDLRDVASRLAAA